MIVHNAHVYSREYLLQGGKLLLDGWQILFYKSKSTIKCGLHGMTDLGLGHSITPFLCFYILLTW